MGVKGNEHEKQPTLGQGLNELNVAPALSVATRSRRKAIERLERLERASAYPSVVACCLLFLSFCLHPFFFVIVLAGAGAGPDRALQKAEN